MSVAYSWEQRIRYRAYFTKEALTTGDFTTIDIIRAQEYVAGVDPIATLRRSVPAFRDAQVEEKLKDINQKTIRACEKDYNRFSSEVEELKNDKNPSQKSWRDQLVANGEKAKEECNNAIDEATDAAIGIIERLPEASQDAAADGFMAATNLVIGFFKNIAESIKKVVQAVVDFIKGIWDKLVNAYKTVKSWAQTAWNAVQGIFSRGSHPWDLDNEKPGPDNWTRKIGGEVSRDEIVELLKLLLDRIRDLPLAS